MDYTEKNLKKLEDYFRNSAKPAGAPFRLGVEIEHFLMKKDTHKSVVFGGQGGVEELFKEIAPHFDKKIYKEGLLVGLECEDYNLSLEPSCQLEISIAPHACLEKIRIIYERFRKLIQPFMDRNNLELLAYGYNPFEKNADMELIPKTRYKFMDKYFSDIHTNGRHMMRSTASTQISIDYYSEEDFEKKFRSVYVLGPVLAMMADNTPVYDGEKNNIYIRRQKIWRDVDPARVNVFDYIPFNHFGFADYARFVYDTPLIVNVKNGKEEYTTLTAREVYKDKEVGPDDIAHILSMVFPMARLKNYIEIRCADSMLLEGSLKLTALIKGIYIKPDKLYSLLDRLQIHGADDTITAEDEVMKYGPEAIVYGMKAADIEAELKKIAWENLCEEERKFL